MQRPSKTPLLLFGITLLTFGFAPLASAQVAGEEPDAEDYIVVYRETPNVASIERLRNRGARLGGTFRHVGAVKARLTRQAKLEMEADPEVEFIAPDQPLQANLDEASFVTGLDEVRWSFGWRGSGVGIAILDSGIKQVTDLNHFGTNRSRIVYSKSFVTGEDANDYFGHGTHVAGIAAATGFETLNSLRLLVGGAEAANLINIKVLDRNGRGSDSTVIAGIDHAIAMKNQYNIRVMNLSLGRPVSSSYRVDPLCRAVERAWRAGILVVASAGNEGRNTLFSTNGYGTINSPGNDPFVLTVGAVNTQKDWNNANDVIATYSSKGPTMVDQIVKPDIVAPGNQILSIEASDSTLVKTFPNNKANNSEFVAGATGKSDRYFKMSGTSMAAPLVAGAAAAFFGNNPNLTPDQVKAALMKTARKKFSRLYDVFSVGAGMMDAEAAAFLIWSGGIPNQPALSPRAFWEASSNSAKISLELESSLRLSNGQCLDVPNSSTTRGEQLIQWPCHDGNNQLWQVRRTSTGHQVVSRSSGMCLNVSGGVRTAGAAVIQWPCGPASELNSIWTPVATGAGFQLRASHSGLCLAVNTAGRLVQNTCANNATQLWTRTDGLPLGQSLVWGDSFNTTLNQTYGTSIVWGDSTVLGTSIVWGDTAIMRASSVVWGDRSVFAAGSVLNQANSLNILIFGE